MQDAGNMRSFSGYTTMMEAWDRLSEEERALVDQGAFGSLVRAWRTIRERKIRANLSLIRAFLDRYWDTTSTFHMPFGEVGVTLEDYGMISGLPCGEESLEWPSVAMRVDSEESRGLIGWNLPTGAATIPGLVPSSYVRDYFAGEAPTRVRIGGELVPPPPCTAEQRARLWLWWFLSSIYFGDKGERLSTKLLPFLV